MNGKKSTKSAFLTSLTSLVVCFAMLLGTTFAWFTDTASTAVNRIQAGTLDVQLLDEDGNSLEGQALKWKKADGAPVDEQVLWEPNCTYQLQPFLIKNNGTLNLKYKIVISGINGDAELNRVIDWTMNNAPINSADEYTLQPGESSGSFTIQGHMLESAGNEYQGKSINGIGVTVYATQVEGEYDTFSNDYDSGATWPIEIIPAVTNQEMTKKTVTGEGSDETTYEYTNSDRTIRASVPAVAVAENETPRITVRPTTAHEAISISEEAQDSVAYDVSIIGASLTPGAPATIELSVGKGLSNVVLYHNGQLMTLGASADVLSSGEYFYDETSGSVTFVTDTFSPFTAVFDAPVAAVKNIRYYNFDAAWAAAQDVGTIYLLKDVTLDEALEITRDMTIVSANHSKLIISGEADRVININDNTEPVTLTLEGIDVVGPTSGTYTRGISAYHNSGVIKLILDNCSVSANYYALNIAGGNANVEVEVRNSTLLGWCAAQTWSSGTKATFKNCTLVGDNDKTYNAEGWNDFATVVINADTTDVDLTFENCRIEANQTTGNHQYLLSVRAAGAKVTLDGCTFFANGSEIADEALGNYISIYGEAMDLQLTIDQTLIPIGE